MHKITKGLKKKKKGKKSKHKEEELFKPEELEAYRKEHQLTVEEAAPATANDEWKKFNALTAGIDSFLKKTQNDLDRIKSTSFFQRVPPPSEVKRERDLKAREQQNQKLETTEKVQRPEGTDETGIIAVSESETEDEDDDDIFDTTYIDAIAAGDVKLAYIPESPTEQAEGDDPFDTSIAERAILGPAVAKKGKKLVPLGSAVEVLTGRIQAPSCVSIKRPSTRRTILKEKDLIFDSFDDNANSLTDTKCVSEPISKPSLLDDDAPLPLADEPIDLSKSLHPICTPSAESLPQTKSNSNTAALKEFDVFENVESVVEDEDDKEFALLAAESLTKTSTVTLLPSNVTEPVKDTWKAFQELKTDEIKKEKNVSEDLEDDPFDTTFAENVVPGKFELKLIENEILSNENDFDFNPRVEEKLEKLNELIKNKVSIQVTNPAGLQDSLERISESELHSIQPEHRDLLGGSITDLTSLGDQPLQPKQQVDENYIEYCDPFDTSLIDSATIPGHTELKLLEKELLSDTNNSDDDFDPRANEISNRKASNASVKVTFTLPLPDLDNSVVNHNDNKRKPLTPYYARENSLLNESFTNENEIEDEDPFDTSFVKNITPGKAELKVIEKELFQADSNFSSLTDTDFNPRDEKQVAVAKVVQTIKELSDKPKVLSLNDPDKVDLFAVDNEVSAKVLTPAIDKCANIEKLLYSDPFDTSIACNILPGKAELKLLETELVHSNLQLKRVLSDPDFNPRDETDINETLTTVKEVKPSIPDLLEHTIENVSTKILTPIEANATYEVDNLNIDPFDTSIANNIGPGQTELKLLESELI